MKKILLAMLACAGMSACTSDDIDLGSGTPAVFEGDKAYIAVRIADVGSSTRATSSGFGNGSSDEYSVGNAYFYFYDSDGLFVTEGEVWDGNGTTYSNNGNLDLTSAKTIILKGLAKASYPKYVVTVLNKPTDFAPKDELSDLLAELSNENAVGIKDDNGKFVMSTTSFADQTDENEEAMPYYVTELQTSDFHLEPIDDLEDIDAIDIYVERLAAKVTVDVASALKGVDGVITEGTNTYYPIEETIAGDKNADLDSDDIGSETLYINILGWKLNGTARRSNILKNIDEDWTDTFLNFGEAWNDPTNHRSYWGMSYNYDKKPSSGAYPTDSNGNTPSDETDEDSWLNEYLKYVNLENESNSPLLALGKDDYCAENTNTASNSDGTNEIIQHKNSSAITSVLLKAQICHRNSDETGWETSTLVRYNGLLYTEKAYKNYILHVLTTGGKINAYYSTDGGETVTRIDSTFVKLSDLKDIDAFKNIDDIDGYFGIELKTDDDMANNENGVTSWDDVTWWTRGTVDSDGNYTYTEVEEEAMEDFLSTLTTKLNDFNTTAEANGYVGGLMYYNIPIEHLNNTYKESTDETTGKVTATVNEANYGIVRNHWYKVTINELSNLGKGITDEDEVIIPEPDDQKTYYVGAEINILSWKLVDQSVSL